ncbi:MAG: aspartate kinase [Paludibacteraceae bacterium]|nr:aspartate kinase [Paludibacteraceae bacterium]MBQ9296592.1 aspartate kinase [Paludibacteraceae bacterium]
MKVYKFGGASVRDAAGVRNLEQIVRMTDGDLLVVVSAMGKTTNALERVVDALAAGQEEKALAQWVDIIDYHVAIMRALGLQPGADVRLQGEIPYDPAKPYDENYDQIVSLGEIMSTQIIAVYLLKQGLPVEWWNVPKLLRTDNTWREAKVDDKVSRSVIRSGWDRPQRPRIVVAQGFIGGTEDGRRTTLGREGSDYSAALFGNYLDAESVTIWKDVPGILNADPRIEQNTVLIPSLRYQDAVELSYSGAQVIHPKTIRPLENKRIPLFVKPFGNPSADGSCISADGVGPVNIPVYIWRKNQILITMRAKDFSFVLEESLHEIFDIIHNHRLKVSLIQSSAVTISVCVDNTRFVADAIDALRAHFNVTYNENLSLLTIRGTTPEILQRARDGKQILLSQTTRRTARLVVVETD